MTPELAAIRDAMSKDTGDGRDMATVVALADAYVADHPDLFTSLQSMSRDECVAALDVFRAAGMEEDQWRVEAWIQHQWEPMNIGGPVEAKVRITNG
ncbi:hypothetical protein [Mycolicibacterium mageritense]|uniref:Uncharacterized protein n=1 Tax=Mycolicibacterium mageritense TaxID=53462 RepID=A0AAI8TYX0_MYCME|nr:hypothetical protein [Mycolicibacterium mageritense]BDY31426.1 hypothetical protein hbim_05378 [Mycolicibacterium mageritense]